MSRQAVITGGGGFIGSHLREELDGRGYDVTIFDRKYGHDVRNREDLHDVFASRDVVFNLAGVLGTDELNRRDRIPEAIETNINGTVNVLDVACEHDVDVVQIAKPNPWLNTYSITKEAERKFAQLYGSEHGLDVWIARWFNVYGPGQHYGEPKKLVPTATVHALKDLPITVYGDGTQTTDHIYVEDAVRATVDIYETNSMEGQIVEVGTGDDRSVNDVVESIKSVTDSSSLVKHVPMRSGERPETTIRADITLLHSKVGFQPEWDLMAGLEATAEYYETIADDIEVVQSKRHATN